MTDIHYATGYGINANELFTRFPVDEIHFNMWSRQKREYAASVWTYSFLVILEDIIENSTTFCLPVKFDSWIEMKRISGEEFKKARQSGAFQEVDILKSNFCGHNLQFRFRTPHSEKKKRIYVDHARKNKITKYTNEGRKYY